MKKIVLLLATIIFSSSLLAVDKEVEAKKLVLEAAKFAKSVGKKKAIKEFNDDNGKFTKGEFYIFALDMKGVTLANKNKRLIGRDMYNLRDLNREYFIRKFIKAAKSGAGWVTYFWKNPIKRGVSKKSSYVMRIDKSYFIGCGFYHAKKKTIVGDVNKKTLFLDDKE